MKNDEKYLASFIGRSRLIAHITESLHIYLTRTFQPLLGYFRMECYNLECLNMATIYRA